MLFKVCLELQTSKKNPQFKIEYFVIFVFII